MTEQILGDALRARSRFAAKRLKGPPGQCWIWTADDVGWRHIYKIKNGERRV